ncbi:MAG: non-canonical purine NTP pyrophosphatase, partial [Erysipelotrichaceae bacterium]
DQIIEMLQDASDRSAYYECDIAYLDGDEVVIFDGIMEGAIAKQAVGSNGFGYDPIFIPNGHDITLAQMSAQEKNQISHRSIALAKFLNFLKSKEQ